MDFQVRYQVLTVLIPMSLFIVASDLVGLYGRQLIRRAGVVWVPEIILAVTAGAIFLLSPVMLRYLWRTEELPASPLRSRLEETCQLMGLRYRRDPGVEEPRGDGQRRGDGAAAADCGTSCCRTGCWST